MILFLTIHYNDYNIHYFSNINFSLYVLFEEIKSSLEKQSCNIL